MAAEGTADEREKVVEKGENVQTNMTAYGETAAMVASLVQVTVLREMTNVVEIGAVGTRRADKEMTVVGAKTAVNEEIGSVKVVTLDRKVETYERMMTAANVPMVDEHPQMVQETQV